MSLTVESAAPTLVVNGTRIETIERGAGRPLLFLHAENGIEPAREAIDELAKTARVIAPTHPGFGRSELPKGMRSVDDLSYFYLDLLDQLDLRDVTVVGVSLGAWIAAEIAVKSTARLTRLVMANAVGIKIADRETRDIADVFALTEKEFLEIAYCDAARVRATTRRCLTAKCSRRHGRARPQRALPGTRISTIRGSRAGCTASAFRRCFCGARMTVCSARPMAAPIAR